MTQIENAEKLNLEENPPETGGQSTSEDTSVQNKQELLPFKNDIALATSNASNTRNASEILNIIDDSWVPPANFSFPTSTAKNLSFQRKWLEEFHWLAYSAKENGAYCKCCIAFGVKTGGIRDVRLGKLINKPFNTWKHAKETFRNHEKLDYHKKSIVAFEHLRDIQFGKTKSIDEQLDKQKEKTKEENYERLKPIVSAIVLCGRQGIALRGHRDDGCLYNEEEPDADDKTDGKYSNEGNFRAILRYRAEGDETLKNNLLSAPKNSTYLSKTIQNEIIAICHELIRKKIVDRINQSEGFSVLADESTDISSIEQFSICTRYLDSQTNICEDFLGFVPVTDVSGQALANSIRNYLTDIGVDCSFMYGQGYDGAPAMSGEIHGAQAYLRSHLPLAIYVHCAAHSFSLTINAACEVSGIKNALGTIGAIQAFFHWPKRQSILKNEISKMTEKSERRKEKLKSICPTRWAQSHEAVSRYVELQPAVIEALEEIKTWKDRETSGAASQLLTAIFTIEFQISCHIMESINSIVLPWSRELQLKNQDLGEATKLADDALNDFKDKRENVDSCFHIVYQKVSEICSEYEIEMKMPRRCSRQKNRCNVEAKTVEEYYKIAFYIPFLDTYISHLQSRFEKHKTVFQSFGQLFLKQEFDEKKCASLYQFYKEILDCSESNFISEVKMWRQRICNQNIENALDALAVSICQIQIIFG